MTLDELKKIEESLEELIADPEIDFGPAYEMAKIRKEKALRIVRRAIKEATPKPPKCVCCGTTKNLHSDGWYGYRCSSLDCMVF